MNFTPEQTDGLRSKVQRVYLSKILHGIEASLPELTAIRDEVRSRLQRAEAILARRVEDQRMVEALLRELDEEPTRTLPILQRP